MSNSSSLSQADFACFSLGYIFQLFYLGMNFQLFEAIFLIESQTVFGYTLIISDSLLIKGWFTICAEVILFVGSHLKHYAMNESASLGQFGITVDKGTYANSGIPIPLLVACFNPSGQLTPGDPRIETILLIWSIYEVPRKRGFPRYISATMQPTAKISMAAEQVGNLKSNSGARYHLVDMYSVYGGLLLISLLNPKSMILMVRSLEISMFSGFISRWKNPCLWMQSSAYESCLVMYLISYSSSFYPFSFRYVINLYRSFSMYSKTKQAQFTTRITSLSFTMLLWFIFLNAFTQDNCRHSSQVPYFFFKRLMATIYFVSVFSAFSTFPNVPEPSFFRTWYFYIQFKIIRLNLNSSTLTSFCLTIYHAPNTSIEKLLMNERLFIEQIHQWRLNKNYCVSAVFPQISFCLTTNVELVLIKEYGACCIQIGIIDLNPCQFQQYLMELNLDGTNIAMPNLDIQIQSVLCKICHQESDIPNTQNTFCSCKPRYGYMHEECLKNYLQKKINHFLDIEANYQQVLTCQKCSQNYRVEHKIMRKCSDPQKILKNMKRKSFQFGIYIFALVISIIIVATCSNQVSQNGNQIDTFPIQQRAVLISFIIFFSAVILLTTWKIIQKFLTGNVVKIHL